MSPVSWRQQDAFNEIMMTPVLYYTNELNWNFIVLVHWNKSQYVNMSLHADTFLDSKPTSFYSYSSRLKYSKYQLYSRWLEPSIWYTTLEVNTLTITPSRMWFLFCFVLFFSCWKLAIKYNCYIHRSKNNCSVKMWRGLVSSVGISWCSLWKGQTRQKCVYILLLHKLAV